MNASTPANTPTIDFLILADRAEAISGKLYMMGGGWDHVGMVPGVPTMFSIACAVMVPWHATNQDHLVTLSLQDADAKELLKVQAGFRTGRPPTLEEGAAQRVMFAFPTAILFPAPGTYVLIGAVGEDVRRVAVYVQPMTQPTSMMPPIAQ